MLFRSPQNAVLEILNELQLPGSQKVNGIYFFLMLSQLQLVRYKNMCFGGEKTQIIPPSLDKKLHLWIIVI